MPKSTQTPGTALGALLKKYKLNYNRLAKAIGLSSAMVRLIARDENPVSASVAFRLAKFFKMKPEYWLSLQTDYDLSRTASDKKLAKELKDIPTVDKATFERKPRTVKSAKKGKKAAASKKAAPKKAGAKKTAKKPKAAASKKAAPKKAAAKAKAKSAGKRGRPAKSAKPAAKKPAAKKPAAKKPAAKKPAAKKPAAKKPAAKKPAAKKPAAKKPAKVVVKHPAPIVKPEPKPAEVHHPVSPPPPPPPAPPESSINEPQI
jgi:addiction module HigA family antidote